MSILFQYQRIEDIVMQGQSSKICFCMEDLHFPWSNQKMSRQSGCKTIGRQLKVL